jgi:Flp pilus assembly protein TadG
VTRRHHSRQRGQSAVEFGLSAVVLLLLVLGLTDLGRVFYFGVGFMGAAREGARQATWFDPGAGNNPYLYDSAIKAAVDNVLTNSGLPASSLQNSAGTTCPRTSDGNAQYNPPYTDDAYAGAGANQPLLFICYASTPGLDVTLPQSGNTYKGQDVNVIVLMNFGFATGFMQGVLGNSIHLAANTHMVVGGW